MQRFQYRRGLRTLGAARCTAKLDRDKIEVGIARLHGNACLLAAVRGKYGTVCEEKCGLDSAPLRTPQGT